MDNGPRRFVYRIDGSDVVTYVSDAWLEFAEANDTPTLTEESVLGRSIWDLIVDAGTRQLYELIFEKVRRGRVVTVPFRCDSPTVRRFMELGLFPGLDGAIELEGRLLREEHRDAAPLLDAKAKRSDEHLKMCGWCKRVRAGDEWKEVEEAMQNLQLVQPEKLPNISHGACDDCRDEVLAAIGTG